MDKRIKNILCFGDSNTHGYNAEDMGRFKRNERWTGILYELLSPDYYIIEEGLGGRTTVFDDPLTEGLSGLKYIRPCMLTHKPIDLLIIMLGTNDVKQRFSLTPHNIGDGLRHLIKKAKNTSEAWYNKPNILIMAPPPIGEGYRDTHVYNTMGEACDIKSRKLSSIYENLAKEMNYHFLDAAKIDGVSMHTNDYMHICKDGHFALAKYLSDFIPSLF